MPDQLLRAGSLATLVGTLLLLGCVVGFVAGEARMPSGSVRSQPW